MIVLGSVYFQKLLEVCDLGYLQSYAELVGPILSEGTGTEYKLSQLADPQTVTRWSKGIFNEPTEQALKFPRVIYVFRSASENSDERWRITVFFTPIPHIKGSYGNKRAKHTISAPFERKLGTRLVESCLADTFDCKTDKTTLGSAAGIYLRLKLLSIPLLRERFEAGKYTPPGSELRALLEVLPAILPETGPSSTVIEFQNGRSYSKDFLDEADQRVVTALGKQRLEAILKPIEISADKWLSAGKKGLW